MGEGEPLLFSQNYACPDCGISIEELAPRMFSFNSPFGACPTCTGLGVLMKMDPDLILPDKSLTLLDDKAIALYPDDGFDTMVSELYAMNRRKPSVQKQLDHVAKYSYPGVQADNQGRILLPVKLRQYVLGDARDVEISGALDHVRIVDSAAAQREDEYYREHRDEILDEIGNLDE